MMKESCRRYFKGSFIYPIRNNQISSMKRFDDDFFAFVSVAYKAKYTDAHLILDQIKRVPLRIEHPDE